MHLTGYVANLRGSCGSFERTEKGVFYFKTMMTEGNVSLQTLEGSVTVYCVYLWPARTIVYL